MVTWYALGLVAVSLFAGGLMVAGILQFFASLFENSEVARKMVNRGVFHFVCGAVLLVAIAIETFR